MEWYQVSAFTGSLELLITTHVHLVSFPDHHHIFWVLNAFCFSMMIQFCILNSDPNWWNPESKLSSTCANSVYQALFLPLLRAWERGYSLECWYHVLRPFKATNLGTRLAFCLSHRFAWVIIWHLYNFQDWHGNLTPSQLWSYCWANTVFAVWTIVIVCFAIKGN